MRSCIRHRRRGVLLLVVLGLLSMFAMIGLTFVVLTGQARRIAEVGQSVEVQYVPPQSDLDRAMAQVARGSDSLLSAIGPHSLLEDMYGHDPNWQSARRMTLSNVNQIWTVPTASGTTIGSILELQTTIASSERYAGSVLTMLTGPAAGCSARIIGYLTGGGRAARFQVLSTDRLDYTTLTNYLRQGGQSIIYMVNGMPFSGKGFGAYSNNGTLSETALQPGNHRYGNWPNGGSGNSAGEANEDYDAPDHQNMLLAMVKGPVFPGTGTALTGDDTIRVPIPSLHRPDLARYWVSQGRANDAMRYILRPLRGTPDNADNPNSAGTIHRGFTGSNPGRFNPLWDGTYANSNGGTYKWDVDNDGDGTPDSVWVDLGMQVRSTADGRLYKPLFAILCTDLDGRVNLNAHGCPAQLNNSYYTATDVSATWMASRGSGGLSGAAVPAFAGGEPLSSMKFPVLKNFTGETSLYLWRGLGCGPAEVNPLALFDTVTSMPSGANAMNLVSWLFRGRGTTLATFEGRYGETAGSTAAFPGLANFQNGYTPSVYALQANRNFPYAKNYYGTLDAYGTPPDLDGDCAIALDVAGRPVYWGMGEAQSQTGNTVMNPGSVSYPIVPPNGDFTRNSPYEINLFRDSAWRRDFAQARSIDNPFTPGELERVLRAGDIDSASLPPRLLALTSDGTGNPANSVLLRRAADITTESWDLPCPPVILPPERRGSYVGPAYHLMYLLQMRTGLTGANLVARARQLFAPEWLNGLRMDLNRPFGNGRDNSAKLNDVVDEPDEVAGERLTYIDTAGTQRAVGLDPSNGNFGGINGGNTRARQFYARNLYCMALLLFDVDNTLAKDPNVRTRPNACKLLAQWAVNVVDFYDRDSTMTRFPYVIDPFTNGWPNTGNDAIFADPSKGGVVWGVERPELVFTESLAFHDRRTTDTNEETPDGARTDDPDEKKRDNDYDQKLRPQGSLFFELFNPWSPDDVRSGEIHARKTRVSSTTGNALRPATAAVNLAAATPAEPGSGTRQDPVWQILVTRISQNPADLDNPENPTGQTVERAIYFRNPDQLPKDADLEAQVRYYPERANEDRYNLTPSSYIAPGEYAVVGPGDETEREESHTYIGFETGKDHGEGTTRQITLNLAPGARSATVVTPNNGNRDLPSTDRYIRSPVPIIINRSSPTANSHHQRMSISEPIGGYDEDKNNDPAYSDGRWAYNIVSDIPVDVSRANDDLTSIIRGNEASSRPVRVLHLRRLANPLKPYNNGRTSKNPEDQNLYITVDSIPVDLTAFSGADVYSDKELGGGTEDRKEPLDSRERGDNGNSFDPYEFWSQEARDSLNVESRRKNQLPLTTQHYYTRPFTHTLGYLNSCYGTLDQPPAPQPPQSSRPEILRGDPQRPFPWFNWNNRPFFSAYELMLVPYSNSAELLNPEYFGRNATSASSLNYYSSTNSKRTWPDRHLWNFFRSDPYSAAASIVKGAPFYRLLEMVEVPSRYSGTRIQLDPAQMANTGNLEHYFHPPFHWVSAYREPGRVNINTIYSYDVFRAVMNYTGGAANNPALTPNQMAELWGKVVRSRRGDAAITNRGSPANTYQFLSTVNNWMLQLYPSAPSRFGNPFRSYGGATLRHQSQTNALNSMTMTHEIHSTLMRGDPDTRTTPLFMYTSTQPHEETARNPFFRYRMLERLGNTVTTRSNVYAVWITVGYFEVRRSNNTAFPDGYELGQELGMDSGDVQRHRGFYIFDRTIPVGFARGQDLNYEKALVLRRFIE
jgi:hypothetical protein